MSTTTQPSPNGTDTSRPLHIFFQPNSNSSTTAKNAADLSNAANVILFDGNNSVADGACAPEQPEKASQILIINSHQQLHEQQQDIPATDSGRASVNEFDTNLEESVPATVLEISATNGADTRAVVATATTTNSKDMEIPATILSVVAEGNAPQDQSKKHCSAPNFYASSGSQTKWYLPPAEICTDASGYVVTSTQPSVAVNNIVIISTSSVADASKVSPQVHAASGDAANAIVEIGGAGDET
ncbi:uncharacterized protein LOC128859759 [Anastrepha ludens]|uniref:uncharacterized protein LOC128859759 n=1 Tax=Anastrepha ludens TaxID=28586 RepID=UPI0023B0FD01|nr:uncharacterized protein LOC128859759 [Anastrepha ludens]